MQSKQQRRNVPRHTLMLVVICLFLRTPHGYVTDAAAALGLADVLIGTNGERFVGRVLSETAESVVFESEFAGRLTVPRARIRELQRPQPPITDNRSSLRRPAQSGTAEDGLITNNSVVS